ncbi:lipase [Kitasatospora herbaricolor]|uniref:alpha/beta fold hydrolase n=1 Tax=Kitasatospora herbaricolor TaxID=68217 RepID=UPI00174DFAAD|nr:alpha/beta hydrolase [Kitasatospora herbaricolor]MDQ0308841.1 pimeloyl-ACP methyl ester carboxylesterase [Kitasatospora herbaricolor]GGV09911.1 lipase [Kitasatospora herbaricolor]
MSEEGGGSPIVAVARAAETASAGVSRAGLIGISVGVVAAGAAAGVAVERLTVGRAMRRRAREALDATASYGSLRGRPRTVAAPDGTELYVELDGSGWPGPVQVHPEEQKGPRRGWFARRRGEAGPVDRSGLPGLLAGSGALVRASSRRGFGGSAAPAGAPLTVVFCHGYCLSQDSWHFQRAALREGMRLVFWDQRSHGRSERSRSFLAGEPASIDQLGGDLKAVIDAVAPEGPLVLVGHSMGGMTVMALADRHPELFRERVAGVALVGTLASDWDSVTLGLPAFGAKVFRRVAPGMMKLLGRQVELVEATRRFGADFAAVFYRRFSFGTQDVDPGVARFAEQLLDATPIDVVAEFYPAFGRHDKHAALAAMRGIPALVLAGTRDLLTPPAHSEAIARELPDAELLLVENAGHLVMLERPELVDRRLAALLQQAVEYAGAAPLPPSVREAGQPE